MVCVKVCGSLYVVYLGIYEGMCVAVCSVV